MTPPGLGEADERALLSQLLESRSLGFLGPGPVEAHVAHALGFAALVPPSGAVIDLGAGGGVPGLVLLAALPELKLTLLESNQRRCRFLETCINDAGWSSRATVVEARAEEAARLPRLRHAFDAAVARSFGAPAVTAECGAPFLRLGGVLIVSEPPERNGGPDRWPTAPLAALGLERSSLDLPDDGPHFVALTATSLCGKGVPRRVGLPSKRPLFSSHV